jgi:hypothetical protein
METAVRVICFGKNGQKVTLKEKGTHFVAKFLLFKE